MILRDLAHKALAWIAYADLDAPLVGEGTSVEALVDRGRVLGLIQPNGGWTFWRPATTRAASTVVQSAIASVTGIRAGR